MTAYGFVGQCQSVGYYAGDVTSASGWSAYTLVGTFLHARFHW